MRGLVLSLFPGIGMFDRGFEEEGFCVVRGPDVIWGGDIRTFRPPLDRFDGIIGGPPCQSFSALANLVRAKGLEPAFGNLIPEFSRCIEEARTKWFVMENVPKAPDPKPLGYEVTSFLLDNCWLGEAQMRKRRFWFGWDRMEPAPNLRRWIPGVALELPEALKVPTAVAGHDHAPGQRDRLKKQAVAADSRAVPVRHGGSGKVKTTSTCAGTGGGDPSNPKYRGIPNRTLAEMLELQGFPPDWLDHQPWTMSAKRKMVGNGVPLPMSRAIARAVAKALGNAG